MAFAVKHGGGRLEVRSEICFSLQRPTIVAQILGCKVFCAGRRKMSIAAQGGVGRKSRIQARSFIPPDSIRFNEGYKLRLRRDQSR